MDTRGAQDIKQYRVSNETLVYAGIATLMCLLATVLSVWAVSRIPDDPVRWLSVAVLVFFGALSLVSFYFIFHLTRFRLELSEYGVRLGPDGEWAPWENVRKVKANFAMGRLEISGDHPSLPIKTRTPFRNLYEAVPNILDRANIKRPELSQEFEFDSNRAAILWRCGLLLISLCALFALALFIYWLVGDDWEWYGDVALFGIVIVFAGLEFTRQLMGTLPVRVSDHFVVLKRRLYNVHIPVDEIVDVGLKRKFMTLSAGAGVAVRLHHRSGKVGDVGSTDEDAIRFYLSVKAALDSRN